MFRAPPLEKRATWNVATIVEPHAKLSGSASVACIGAAAAVRIARDQAGDDLAVGADLVGRVGGDEVGAAPARDAVTAAARDVDPVVSGACADPVRFRRTEQEVGSRAADDQRCACGNGEKKREPRRRQQGGALHRVPPLPSRSGAMDGYR